MYWSKRCPPGTQVRNMKAGAIRLPAFSRPSGRISQTRFFAADDLECGQEKTPDPKKDRLKRAFRPVLGFSRLRCARLVRHYPPVPKRRPHDRGGCARQIRRRPPGSVRAAQSVWTGRD